MTNIGEFFAGSNVFITGLTGFLGKVLVEKLLRSCPDVKTIYVLIREKRGHQGQDRLNSILSQKLFDTVRNNDPTCMEKVKYISGDLLKKPILAKDSDFELLTENVNIVIHSAASVRFSEPLRNSVEMNLDATYKVLELAKSMKNLKSFVHVSTAYVNCHLNELEERVYPCEVSPHQILGLCDWMTDEMLDHLCPKLLKDRPNTYTFTKALAESLVQEYAETMPIVIVRPSIITGSATEPVPGWVDNFNGPNGLLIALGTGVLTTLYTQLDCIADLIPVDFVSNTVLAAAPRAPEGFKVFNCASGTQNPIKWRTFMEQSIDFPHRYPTTSIVRYPHPRVTSHRMLHKARLFLQHYLPAQVIDGFLRCAGKKPVLSGLYDRLSDSMELLEFFATHEWKFHTQNTRELFERLSPVEKNEFNFDVDSIDWPSYVQNYCLGIRRFILKEDISNLDQAKRHLLKLKYINYATNAVIAIGAWKACCAILPCSEMTGLC